MGKRYRIKNILVDNLQRIISIISYPELLGTLGKDINRAFVKELLFLKRNFCILPNTFIDVGAAIGEFTKAARFVFPAAAIYAFEPIPISFAILKRSFQRDDNISAYNLALSSQDKIASFHLNEFSFSSSLLEMTHLHKDMFPHTQKENIISVECKRLDAIEDLVLKKPVFMKIDVQGAELEVLRGAEQTLRHIDVVKLELNFEKFYEGQAYYADIFNQMDRLGFRVFIQINPEFADAPCSLPIYCDLVFFK